MTATIIRKKNKKDRSTGKQTNRRVYTKMPAEAAKMVREGWEDLDTAVDKIRDGIVAGFLALLEAPLRIMEASVETKE